MSFRVQRTDTSDTRRVPPGRATASTFFLSFPFAFSRQSTVVLFLPLFCIPRAREPPAIPFHVDFSYLFRSRWSAKLSFLLLAIIGDEAKTLAPTSQYLFCYATVLAQSCLKIRCRANKKRGWGGINCKGPREKDRKESLWDKNWRPYYPSLVVWARRLDALHGCK